MSGNEKKKAEKVEDIEIPTLDDEIQNWCKVPAEKDDKKSADDIEIDSWCEASVDEDKDLKSKAKKQ